MRVLGCDPGFASFGWCSVRITGAREELIALGVIRTEPETRKLGVLAADDDVRRTREIAARLREELGQADVVAAEAFSQPRHAASAAKLARSWGALVALAGALPLTQASPQQIKLAVAGSKTATKEAVERAVRARWQSAGVMLDALPKTLREHAADACGAVIACLGADVIRMGRRL